MLLNVQLMELLVRWLSVQLDETLEIGRCGHTASGRDGRVQLLGAQTQSGGQLRIMRRNCAHYGGRRQGSVIVVAVARFEFQLGHRNCVRSSRGNRRRTATTVAVVARCTRCCGGQFFARRSGEHRFLQRREIGIVNRTNGVCTLAAGIRMRCGRRGRNVNVVLVVVMRVGRRIVVMSGGCVAGMLGQ